MRRPQRRREGQVAEGVEACVRRVVVRGVEGAQALPRQLRDRRRLAARVVVVGRRRVERRRERAGVPRALRAHRALHLVVHDALALKRRRWVIGPLELEPVALLTEVGLSEQRKEGSIQVDAEQVMIVLGVLRRERVHRVVARGHRVHKRGERALEHVEERVAYGEALAAAERGVLEDVSDAGRVLGRGAEGHVEGVGRVGRVDVQPACSSALVAQLDRRSLKLRQRLDSFDLEAVQAVASSQLERRTARATRYRGGCGGEQPVRGCACGCGEQTAA